MHLPKGVVLCRLWAIMRTSSLGLHIVPMIESPVALEKESAACLSRYHLSGLTRLWPTIRSIGLSLSWGGGLFGHNCQGCCQVKGDYEVAEGDYLELVR